MCAMRDDKLISFPCPSNADCALMNVMNKVMLQFGAIAGVGGATRRNGLCANGPLALETRLAFIIDGISSTFELRMRPPLNRIFHNIHW